jgi:polysaccharide export outer membrane protein
MLVRPVAFQRLLYGYREFNMKFARTRKVFLNSTIGARAAGSRRFVTALTRGLLIISVHGCAAATTATTTPGSAPIKESASVDTVGALQETRARENQEVTRLAQLWEQRRQQSAAGDYPVGPGDVIEVSVADMKEITTLSVRVTGEGTISLPFVGVMKVNGVPERAIREEIKKRLQAEYMHNPQVSLFVKEFQSRQVAVIGAVQKPGLYKLTSYSDTIFEMISQAGGTTTTAAERILFIPAEPADPDKVKMVAAALPTQVTSQDPTPLILKNVDPIVINLATIVRGGNEKYLAIPARPGDVIMVPGSGEVLVQGWVEKPGSYKITPGLTVLGAVAAAGGAMYPADVGTIQIIRTNKQGQKTTITADLEAIKRGEQPDVAVMESDVIDIGSSGPKMVAYGIYRFFTTVMRVGASVPLLR